VRSRSVLCKHICATSTYFRSFLFIIHNSLPERSGFGNMLRIRSFVSVPKSVSYYHTIIHSYIIYTWNSCTSACGTIPEALQTLLSLLERHTVDAPQMAKHGRIRHRFYERVGSVTRATICGATTGALDALLFVVLRTRSWKGALKGEV
jgi:hypothetical protein